MHLIRLLFALLALGLGLSTPATATVAAIEAGIPLDVGQRTVHTFRAPLGMFTPAERAEAARRRIEAAFQQGGEGWTWIRPTEQGFLVELDGQALFLVLPGDALSQAGETPEGLANQASRLLQKAWAESREQQNTRALWNAALKAMLATIVLLAILALLAKLSSKVRYVTVERLRPWLKRTVAAALSARTITLIPALIDRIQLLLTWLLALGVFFVYLSYTLSLFVVTRPTSERLAQSLNRLGDNALAAVADALPGLFIAIVIFLLAWIATKISAEFFDSVERRPDQQSPLNTHTAPATRRIVNAMLWLFAVAMAYPYLPGSHTEAFKGLSVIVGLMVSIGASGVVGQIASGVMIVYTYALKKGEYVRILDCEGTVTELGLFVTRLRTGMGEEIALPNALVLGNVTRNFSRVHSGRGYVLDTTVTIGYDTPWRQVHAILIEATQAIPEIFKDPQPYVMQTALSDFYVAYKLVVYVQADAPAERARVASDLHAAIQDAFNRHDVQIMSPHYLGDPPSPKTVPQAQWFAAPARKP